MSLATQIGLLATRIGQEIKTLHPTAWTAATLVNSWANVAGQQPVQYRKTIDVVAVRGWLSAGEAGSAATTLPVGFRPPYPVVPPDWVTGSDDGAGFDSLLPFDGGPAFSIGTDGVVTVYVATVQLDIAFSTI